VVPFGKDVTQTAKVHKPYFNFFQPIFSYEHLTAELNMALASNIHELYFPDLIDDSNVVTHKILFCNPSALSSSFYA
jgi:hypothetical protein